MSVDGLMVVFAGGLFLILVALLAWIGNRVHNRLDDLTRMLDEKLTGVSDTLSGIERDLRQELSHLDRRVGLIEAMNKIRRSSNGAND